MTRPPKAITRPRASRMGNMMRSRKAVVVTLTVAHLPALTLDDQAGIGEALALGVAAPKRRSTSFHEFTA